MDKEASLALVRVALVAAFMALAILVYTGATQAWDEEALSGIAGAPSGWGRDFFEAVTFLGSYIAVAVATAVGAILLLRLSGWPTSVYYILVVVAGCVLAEGIKLAMERPRPDLVLDLSGEGFSFPSSHATAVVCCYGGLVVWLRAWWKRRATRMTTPTQVAIVVAAILVISLVALSRLYLGWHYPTDVLGGLLLGCVLALPPPRSLSDSFIIP